VAPGIRQVCKAAQRIFQKFAKKLQKGLSALPEVFQNSGTKPQAGPHATKKG
jgi:hypothetical protein